MLARENNFISLNCFIAFWKAERAIQSGRACVCLLKLCTRAKTEFEKEETWGIGQLLFQQSLESSVGHRKGGLSWRFLARFWELGWSAFLANLLLNWNYSLTGGLLLTLLNAAPAGTAPEKKGFPGTCAQLHNWEESIIIWCLKVWHRWEKY